MNHPQIIHKSSKCQILSDQSFEDDDSLKCWGSGSYGRLGLGSTSHMGDDPDEMGDSLPAIDLGGRSVARRN